MAAASTPSIGNGIVLEVLTRDNYNDWSTLAKDYLIGQGLWEGIVVGDSDPNSENSDWSCKNGKALHAIRLSCGSENLPHIRKCTTAREAWNILNNLFGNDEKAKRAQSLQKLTLNEDIIYLQLLERLKTGYRDDENPLIGNFLLDLYGASCSGRTIFHMAVIFDRLDIVNELVSKIGGELLRVQDNAGYTALALAAELTDNVEMAQYIVETGGLQLLTMKTTNGKIPLLLASAKGHKEMTKYLFSTTPFEVLLENGYRYGIMLLSQCIAAQLFEIAAALLQHPCAVDLPLTLEADSLSPVYALVQTPSAFPSGSQLGWRQRFIYRSKEC